MADLAQRYSRAARLTAPKSTATAPDGIVEGYWLDVHRFFFRAERVDGARPRVTCVPSLFDRRTGQVEEVIPLQMLEQALTDRSGRTFDREALWSSEMPDVNTLVLAFDGQDYQLDRRDGKVRAVCKSQRQPALYSPDRRHACVLRGQDLWISDRENGAERPLTRDGRPHSAYGQPSEGGLSTLAYRRNPAPLGLWSNDSQWFLSHRIEERAVPALNLLEHVPQNNPRPVLHQFRYPMPGDALPIATYVAIHVSSNRMIRFESEPAPVLMLSPFFLKMAWFGKGNVAWVLREEREGRQLDLIRLDLATGSARVTVSERATSGYVDANPVMARTPNVRTLTSTDEIIWFSERSGWGHLYLYDAVTGALKHPITGGEWSVRDIVQVDEISRRVWFLADGLTAGDPARRALCAVNLDGSGFDLLLWHEGDLFVPGTAPSGIGQDSPFRPAASPPGLSPDGAFAVVQYRSVTSGNRTEMVDLRTRSGVVIAEAAQSSDEPRARPFDAPAADGRTPLHGVMFLPCDFDEMQQYPLVDYIYPGPHVAHQPQAGQATDSAQARALAELGFVTLMLDTRGMPIGSRAFRQAGYGSLLEPQLADHASVVKHLCEAHAFLDRDRIGIFGYSGGGYAAARALCDYGDVFKAGVAVCGNYDPDRYTAAWAEKYCGPGSHEDQAVRTVAHRLQGKLFLISGDMDENVHVAHTLGLADALIRADKEFDLLIVPQEGHALLMTHGYTLRRVWDWFVRHLLGKTPPAGFELHYEAHELAAYARRRMREIRQ